MTDIRDSTSARGGAAPGVDEFAHIRSPRARHPVLAGAAALLALYLVIHVRADVRYALSSGEPLELGDARETFAPRLTISGLDDRYVVVRGAPDRESGLEVDTKGSWTFSQFFRILGTGNRLFVHRRESPLPGAKAEVDVFTGRLVRFGELPFEDAVRAYFSAHVAASHFFAPKDLRDALRRGGAVELRDLAGDPVTIAPDELLFVDAARAGEVRVFLPRARFPDADQARAEIVKRGGVVTPTDKPIIESDAKPASSTPPPAVERWAFVVTFPADERDAALDALADLDREVRIQDARETIKVRLSDVTATDDGLAMRPGGGSERRLGIAEIAAVKTVSTAQIPPDAYLLIEADRPRDHLSTLLLALAVATFGVFNLAAVFRELRR
ncbi:MAG TPA: hypothetical protein VHJ20_04400 [Polyangia bacterium]|nr:hypothetical protein [Polyangia bacterium]